MLGWMLLGTREDIDELGFLIQRCPACATVSVFSVYQTKRKLTIYFVPTVSLQEQQVLECRTCGAKFQPAPALRDALPERLMTREQVAARVQQAQLGALVNGASAPANGRRTYYQILQVDPAADPEVIEAAFKRLALKYHPDRSTAPDAPARMRELIEARDHLADPVRRRRYDASIGIVHRTDALRADEV